MSSNFSLRAFRFLILVLTLLVCTTISIEPTEAVTIKNGVNCKKDGQKTRSGKKNYVCGKNPYVSPTRLTWMMTSCPEAYDLYAEARDQYGLFKDILSASPEGQVELAKLQKKYGRSRCFNEKSGV